MSFDKLPAVPFKNTLEKQQIAHRMFNHKRRLVQLQLKKSKRSQSQIPMQAYKTLIQDNPKRNYFLESKYTEIQRENRILFEKISKISRKKKKDSSLERNRSLNITFRKKQIQQIQNENVRIYNRILRQKPFISFKQTDKEFDLVKKMSDRLSKKEKYRLEDYY